MDHHHVASTEGTRKICNLFNKWQKEKHHALMLLVNDLKDFPLWNNVLSYDEKCSNNSTHLTKGYREAYSCSGCINISRLCPNIIGCFYIETSPGKGHPPVGKKLSVERQNRFKIAHDYHPFGIKLPECPVSTLCLDVITLNIILTWILDDNPHIKKIYNAYSCDKSATIVSEHVSTLDDIFPKDSIENIENIYDTQVLKIQGLLYQGLKFIQDMKAYNFLFNDIPSVGFIDEPYADSVKTYPILLKFQSLNSCVTYDGLRIIPYIEIYHSTALSSPMPSSVSKETSYEKPPSKIDDYTLEKINKLRKIGCYVSPQLNVYYFLLSFLQMKPMIESEPRLAKIYQQAFNGSWTIENFSMDENLIDRLLDIF